VTFPGLMCAGMKTISGKFRCKQTSMGKVIALAFICVIPHPAHSIEQRIYASLSTEGQSGSQLR